MSRPRGHRTQHVAGICSTPSRSRRLPSSADKVPSPTGLRIVCRMPVIPPLPEDTILLVEVGSTAHGTGLPGGEDHDEMAVVIETPDQVLGIGETGLNSLMQRT